MSDGDVMTRLSEANPVRFADLPEGSAETLDSIVARRRPKRRRVLIAAMATMVAAAAAAAAAGAFRGSSTRVLGLGVGGRPSVERPLLSGSQVSLVGASATLGRPIVLPDTSVVSASDAGPVWMNSGGSVTVIAVTFPNAGLWIDYQRGDNYNDDVLLQFRAIARQAPRIFRVIDLRGVPALAGAQNSDQTGTNFGSIEFYAAGSGSPSSGTRIRRRCSRSPSRSSTAPRLRPQDNSETSEASSCSRTSRRGGRSSSQTLLPRLARRLSCRTLRS